MATKYGISTAYSGSGATLYVPVSWQLDSEDDLLVVAVGNDGIATVLENNSWQWDSVNHQVIAYNTSGFSAWRVYVSRYEDAATLLQSVSTMEVNAQNVIAQLLKCNRIFEQIQESQKTAICSPDHMGGMLPDATHRANKFLTFDQNGKPAASMPVETLESNRQSAQTAATAAVASASSASSSASTASSQAAAAATSASTASAQALVAEGWALGKQNGTDVSGGSPYYQKSAKYFADQASDSAISADVAASNAIDYAERAASSASDAESTARTVNGYLSDAAHYKDQAATSASTAATSASNAATSASTASTQAANAANSASSASSSASTATTKAAAAATSATSAATSASTATSKASTATTKAAEAATSALRAEGWALGKQNGTDVSRGTYYQKNAKYYAQQAAGYASAFSAVLSGKTVLSSLRLGVSGDTRQVLLSATIENGVPSLSLNIASDVLINIPSVLKFAAGNQTVSVSATIENGTPNLTYDII